MHEKNKVLLAILIAIVFLVVLNGMPLYISKGVCQKTKHACHGLPLGKDCIGLEEETTEIIDGCENAREIQQRCNTAGEKLCETNEGTGVNWAEETEVEGHTCHEWSQQYSLNLTTC